MKSKISMNSGQAMMVATIFFLVVSITIIFGLVGPIVRQQKIASALLSSRQSYFLAEAGVEDVVYRLNTGQLVGLNEALTLNGYTATTLTTDTAEGKEVLATADVRSATRKVEVALLLGTGVTFNFGVQVGAGGFELDNNAGVNGNVYSNDDIVGKNGSFITGDAFAAGIVTGVEVGGETQTGVSPQAFPITDNQITAWKNEAAAGGTLGSQSLSGTNTTLGPKKINGNLTLTNGSVLTLSGYLWVTGNIVLSNNTSLRLASFYGSNDGLIVADGTILLDNGSSFEGSGTEGSHIMLLTTSNSGSAIKLSNNAEAAVLYAANGTIELDNNTTVKQLTGKTIFLSNNAILDYEQGLINSAFVSGPSGGYEILRWKEVE